jgi:hypothetical protein
VIALRIGSPSQRQAKRTDALHSPAAFPFLPRVDDEKGSLQGFAARHLAGMVPAPSLPIRAPEGDSAPARQLAGRASSSARPALSGNPRGRLRKYSDAFEQRVCEAYLRGYDAREVAKAFRIPASTVGAIAKRHGIQAKRSASVRQQIIARNAMGQAVEDIARLEKTSRSYVRIVLRECGLLAERLP